MYEKPTAVFRVGVTGHRPNRLSHDILEQLESNIEKLFEQIDNTIKLKFDSLSDFYQSASTPEIRLISGMAAGTDLSAISAAKSRSWQFHAILPQEIEIFKKSLSIEEIAIFNSALELSTSQTIINSAGFEDTGDHDSLGELLLQNIELLVAVWDGAESRGKGGTADLVERALNLGIPVIWLNTTDSLSIRFLESHLNLKNIGKSKTDWSIEFSNYVQEIIQPPSEANEPEAYFRLKSFQNERLTRWNYGVAYPLFQRIFLKRKLRISDIRLPDPEKELTNKWAQEELKSDITSENNKNSFKVFSAYFRADRLAIYYAQVYRSASLLNYSLAAFAVLMALMGLIVGDLKLIWIIIELFLITSVITITHVGSKNRWHERWLDYRQLAESLRVMLELKQMGFNHHENSWRLVNTHQGLPFRWIDWYQGAISRTFDLPSKVIDSEALSAFNVKLRRYIDEQAEYHSKNADLAHKADHKLHILGNICLYGTISSCIVFVALYFTINELAMQAKLLVTFFCALLPAFGAAAFGYRAHADFSGIYKRSNLVALQLKEISTDLKKKSYSYVELANIVHNLNLDNHLELRDWRITFEQKRIAIPA